MMTSRLKWVFTVLVAFLLIGIGGNAWADGNRRDARTSHGYNDRYRHHEGKPYVRPGAPAHRRDAFRRSPRHPNTPRHHRPYYGPQRRGHHSGPPAWGRRDRHHRPYAQPPQRHHRRHHYQAYPQRPIGAGYVFSASVFEPGLFLSFATGGQW